MSCPAPHQAEPIVGLLLQQPLDFELSFRRSCDCYSDVEHALPLWRLALEYGLDQYKCCASQDAVDEKEIFESVCVNSRNPPLHSNVLPALRANGARVGLNICESLASSKFFVAGISTVNPWKLNQFRRVCSSKGTIA